MLLLKKYPLQIILGVLAITTNLIFASHYLLNWDSGQFALAISNFNLNIYQPHPPGYPLFIFVAWLLNLIFRDTNLSFVLINTIASTVSVILIYNIIRHLKYGKKTALVISLLFMTHPLLWHFRTVALTYIFEALTPLLGLYFIIRTREEKQGKFLFHNALAMAAMIGFRPSVMIMALPILLINAWFVKNKKSILWGVFLFTISCLLWLYPLIILSDGWKNYWHILKNQYDSLIYTYANVTFTKFYIKSLFIVLMPYVLFILWKPFQKKENKTTIWIMVSLFTITLLNNYFSHFGNPGYILSLAPLTLLLGLNFFEHLNKNKIFWLIAIILIAYNTYAFFYPVNWIRHKTLANLNWQNVHQHDQRINNYLAALKNEQPQETLLIALRGQYFDQNKKVDSYKYEDIRVLGAYFPQFKIYDLLGVKDIYFLADHYDYQQINADTIYFPKDTKKIIILADYIHPNVRPKEFPLAAYVEDNNTKNYYQADIGQINTFEFYGFKFIRSK